ncbi:MAG: Mut7-C RNAse domain-containing protein [Candidatus Thorarchaeota archaeon]
MKTFVVDSMLGKLATWLRLTGHDAMFSTKIHDDEFLRIAIDTGRVLLTSDEELYHRAMDANAETMLVRGSVDEEVASVFLRYGIEPFADASISRCTKCNGSLEYVSEEEKERIKPLVMEKTYDYYNEFWFCKYCKSVFFKGGQWINIDEYMERIGELMEEMRV